MDKDIDSCITTGMPDGWGGICFDLLTKETWMTQKILAKINRSWENLSTGGWNYSGWESHIGLLFWSLGILDIPIADFFAMLRFHSSVSHKLSESGGATRDQAIDIPSDVMRDLTTWTQLCLANKKYAAPPPGKRVTTWLVCTDACRWGWGMVAVNVISGEVKEFGERWNNQFRAMHHDKLHRSSFTEPQALVNAMCYLLRITGEMQHVIIGTDNIVTKCAFNKGWNAVSYDINECVRRLRNMFPSHAFSFAVQYVPGRLNVLADRLSRGHSSGASAGQISHELRSLLWGNDAQSEELQAEDADPRVLAMEAAAQLV
ncbi:MAG: hypothetical protein AAB263_15800 [Planctomycetota bacterium]